MGKTKKRDNGTNADRIRNPGLKYSTTPEGLTKSRSCTDVICLFIFIIFLVAWIIIGIFAFKDGNPEEILAPIDSLNNKCGFDEGVKNKSYLFYFDLTDCLPRPGNILRCHTPQVCVDKCPDDNFYVDYFVKLGNESKVGFIKSKLKNFCFYGFDVSSIKNLTDVEKAIEDGHCPAWYLGSKAIANHCLPRQLSDLANSLGNININFEDDLGNPINTIVEGVTGQEVSEATDVVKAFAAVNEFGQAVLLDLKNTWGWIVILIAVSVAISLLYIFIMRWITSIVVWFSLLGVLVVLSYCTYYTWTKYEEASNNSTKSKKLTKDIGEDIKDEIGKLLTTKESWLAFFILSCIALGIILIILIFLRNRLRIAVALISEASKAVSHSWTTLIFPIFPWICQVIVIAYGLLILVFLLATGVPIYKVTGISQSPNCNCANIFQDGTICEPNVFNATCTLNCQNVACIYSETETRNYAIYFHLFNLLMALWGLFFVSGFGEMVLASTFSRYYWTWKKSDLPIFIVAESVFQVFRYHLGTIAFGSFLIALCNWIRILIEIIHNQINKNNNVVIKCIKCCCSCFFWCLEKFLKFISKNAYVMCAMHGKNFCVSAKNAFGLLVRNVLRVAVLDSVTAFLFFLSKLMITALVGAIAFYVFSNKVPNFDNGEDYQTEYYFVPLIIVVISAYFIASVFFSVYSMAVDTLFLCFLEDAERNDGSVEKPYFMSKDLMRILGKKNKKLK